MLIQRAALLLALSSFAMSASAQNQAAELEVDRKPQLVIKGDVFIKNGTLLTVTKGVIQNGSILIRSGKIAQIGQNLTPPAGVPTIDATGKFITPGVIDAHSHAASEATNEGTDAITAEVRISDILDPNALGLWQYTACGVTAALILHGSANPIGGQSSVIKLKYKHPVAELIIPDAPRMIKFALGENVKRSNWGDEAKKTPRFPSTRPGVEAVYRRAFLDAKQYRVEWDAYNLKHESNAVPPRRDLRLEALSEILSGRIRVQCHSYNQNEMLMMAKLSKEFGFNLVLQHALEAYKIAPELAAMGIPISSFADQWAYKIEAYDAIPYNAALCTQAGVVASINSDTDGGLPMIHLEAAKSLRYGGLSETDCLKLVTLNAAKQLGIDHRAGSLEVGKDGDLAIWDGHPLSVYSRCAYTLIEGELVFQRRDAFNLNSAGTLHTSPVPPSRQKENQTPAADERRFAANNSKLFDNRKTNVYLIKNATIHTLAKPSAELGDISIENGKIKALGKNLPAPANAVTIDATGLHAYPGLIDGGSSLGLAEIGSIEATNDTNEDGDFQTDLITLRSVNPASEHLFTTRFTGITTALTSLSGGVVAGQASVIHLAGWTWEQMEVRERAALRVNYPEANASQLEFLKQFLPEDQITQLRDQQKNRLRRIKDYFESAKRYIAGRKLGTTPQDLAMDAMTPYLEGKLPVILQVNTMSGIRNALKFAKDLGLKPIIGGGREAWRIADELAKAKIPVLYTPSETPFTDYEPYDAQYAAPELLRRAGVKVGFMSNSDADARNLPFKVGVCCAYGYNHEEAIKALTVNNAEILGISDLYGTLETGKSADIILTDGDPLEIGTQLRHEFIAGKPVKLESKQTRLYEQYRARLK